MSLENNIKKWVHLDNQMHELLIKQRQLKKEKDDLSSTILTYAKDNNISNSTIKISDGKLSFIEQKQTTSLTYNFLYKCLMDYFQDREKVDNIINYIKSNRESMSTKIIKRTYIK